MNAAYVNVPTAAFSLNEAMEVKSHFQYLVGKTYNPHNPALGQIEALFICPRGEGEELIGEYRKRKITNLNGGVFKNINKKNEEYDVMIMAKVGHPQLKAQFEIFKDIRTYASERQITYRF
jgi:hypothetical protein